MGPQPKLQPGLESQWNQKTEYTTRKWYGATQNVITFQHFLPVFSKRLFLRFYFSFRLQSLLFSPTFGQQPFYYMVVSLPYLALPLVVAVMKLIQLH